LTCLGQALRRVLVGRLASVYCRAGRLYVSQMDQTVHGLWIGGRVTTIHLSRPPREIGEAIVAAIVLSRTGVLHPKSFEGGDEPLLDAAGVRSWEEFMVGARHACVSEDDGMITVTTSEPEDGAFVGDDLLAQVVSTDVAGLGELIRAHMSSPASGGQ
jgi:hypothetical protein